MSVTMRSSREFNQEVGRAKRSADQGPVIIMDRGEPAYVLLRHDAYKRLIGGGPSIVELLAQPGAESDFEFDPPRMAAGIFRPADLS